MYERIAVWPTDKGYGLQCRISTGMGFVVQPRGSFLNDESGNPIYYWKAFGKWKHQLQEGRSSSLTGAIVMAMKCLDRHGCPTQALPRVKPLFKGGSPAGGDQRGFVDLSLRALESVGANE